MCCMLSPVLCFLLVSVLAASQSSTASEHSPEWLMGLGQLRKQQPPARVTSSIQSTASTHVASRGQLLRPKTLPPVTVAHLATLQRAAGSTTPQPTLGSVARTYGITQTHLQHMMEADPGLLVSNHGLLVWTCHGHHEHQDVVQATYDTTGFTDSTTLLSSTDNQAGNSWYPEAEPQDLVSELAAEPASEDASQTASISAVGSPYSEADELLEGTFTVLIPRDYGSSSDAAPAESQAWLSSTRADADVPTHAEVQGLNPNMPNMLPLNSEAPSRPAPSAVYKQPGPQPPPHQAFKLHSHSPGSVPHTTFLDFRGCTITDSYWNSASSKPVLQTQPFDLDSDPASFSLQEQQAVVSIWQAVAQDFAPWAVDVTTEDPGADALVRADDNDPYFGMHVCVGGSSASTVGGLSGGLAFTGAWGQLGPGLQPVLVFPTQLGNGHPRAVADSISHEVGHTFGLAHFGGSGSAPYNDGSGPWGPLLGLPYGRVLSQWNQGTAITGSMQDDLQLIAQQLPMLADDHGDTPRTATPLCPQLSQASVGVNAAQVLGGTAPGVVCNHLQDAAADEDGSGQQGRLTKAAVRGVVSNSTDQDWFSVSVGRPGLLRVALQLPSSASGYGVNNLLAAVEIQTQDAAQLAAARPVTGSEVSLTASAEVQVAGTYYVAIIPAGVSGVSSYGSLGDYHLTVTFPSLQPPTTAGILTPTVQQAMRRPTAAHAGPIGVVTGSSSSQGCQGCVCAASKGLVAKPAMTPMHAGTSASASQSGSAADGSLAAALCQYQDIRPLSFSPRACSTAAAGAVALLNFTISTPPACFQGSIIAEPPRLELLDSCPCRQSPRRAVHRLPTAGSGVPSDGSYTCRDGLYSYGWHVTSEPGCYRLSVTFSDMSRVLTVLKVVQDDVVTQAQAA